MLTLLKSWYNYSGSDGEFLYMVMEMSLPMGERWHQHGGGDFPRGGGPLSTVLILRSFSPSLTTAKEEGFCGYGWFPPNVGFSLNK
jgi:hypothetical protein